MTHILKHEWKGLALLAGLLVLVGVFLGTAATPPWNERVLSAMAEQPQTVRPQTHNHIAQK